MDYRITRATEENLEQVAKLFDEYRQFYGQDSDLNLARYFIKSRLFEHDSIIFLAYDEQGIELGFVQLYPSFSSVSAKPILILNDLYVAKHARCVGLGKALINKSLSHARLEGVHAISLQTHETNSQAQKLYKGLGFHGVNDFLTYQLKV